MIHLVFGCRDSNSGTLDCQSPSITTRPGFPPMIIYFFVNQVEANSIHLLSGILVTNQISNSSNFTSGSGRRHFRHKTWRTSLHTNRTRQSKHLRHLCQESGKSNHRILFQGKFHHCSTDLLFTWVRFNQTSTYLNLFLQNPCK